MDLDGLRKSALSDFGCISSLADLDQFEIRFMGRKEGELTHVLRSLSQLPSDQKKEIGKQANELRLFLEEKIQEKKRLLKASALGDQLAKETIDRSYPGTSFRLGSSHPILTTIDDICAIFRKLGFDRALGPDVETDFNNFTALNIPENHPARDMHDTFYLNDVDPLTKKPYVLRTHTSPVQIRFMQSVKPPVRIVAPGRVYRHEAVDATHGSIFHQIEGLAVDSAITFADLKGTLTHFAKEFFGPQQLVRFRPSYFPFVEPGAEMDLQCFVCGGSGTNKGTPCGLCKASGWMEMLGAGMVHPQVLKNVGYDPETVSGFAFGMGIERVVMTRLGIRDIRHFLDPDMRFLEQFR